LHQLVYTIDADGELSGYAPVYYLAYVWQIVLFAAAFILVMVRSRLFRKSWKALIPMFFLLGGLSLFILYYRFGPHYLSFIHIQFQYIYIFMIIGFWESCIQLGFIPSNSEYDRIMRNSSVKLTVADGDGDLKYGSEEFRDLEWNVLKSSVSNPVMLDEDTRLSGRQLTGGFGFWEDDLSAVHELQDELRDTAQLLNEETLLLQKEAQIKEEKARLEVRSSVFDQLGRELEPQMKRIEDLIFDKEGNSLHPACSDEEWRSRIARAAGVGAYVKRKANLYILSRDNDTLELHDLLFSVRESLEYMGLMGIVGSAFANGSGELPSGQVLEAYELCYAFAEGLPGLKAVLVNMGAQPSLNMQLELSGDIDENEASSALSACLNKGPSCKVSTEFEDGVLYISAVWPGKGEKQ